MFGYQGRNPRARADNDRRIEQLKQDLSRSRRQMLSAAVSQAKPTEVASTGRPDTRKAGRKPQMPNVWSRALAAFAEQRQARPRRLIQ